MAKLKSSARAKAGAASTTPKLDAAELKAKAELFTRSLAGSAQQVWSAGVGAFARAQTEGTRLFEALVKEGMNLERNTRQLAAGKVDAMRDAVEEHVGNARERAVDTWDKLEKVFEDRVQRSLTRLGVPGREEIGALIDRVDQLNRELRKLSGIPAARSAPAKQAAARKASSGKPSSKKTAAKKTVTKKTRRKQARSAKA